jgi:D-beta-D-heptose 7-phosphate kinase/D-beta-D-heptose 1-phosphate adenosyltransferase
MYPLLCRLLDAFTGLRVAVLGDAMLDTYLEGQAGRFCPEAPVPAVTVISRHDMPGGAANTAANAARLGACVRLLSVVGDDAEAVLLRQALRRCGVFTQALLTNRGRRTLARQRVQAAGQLLLRLDQGSTETVPAVMERALIGLLHDVWPECDAVIVSDYRYGIVTAPVLRTLAELQARRPLVLVADSRKSGLFREVGLKALKATYDEAMSLLGDITQHGETDRVGKLIAHSGRLLELAGCRLAAVTLDRDGALLLEAGRPPIRTFGVPARNAVVAGAGDTYTAALGLGLAAGAPPPVAAELAAAAAAVAVGKERTATCSAQELREHLGVSGKFVADRERLRARVDEWRAQGRRVVFTNGCFDLLHSGHVGFLHRAKALGDVLVVGVNSDACIRRLKAPGRPVNSLEDRIQVLAALACVDLLSAFDEDTPCNLIRIVRRHAFAKGGDYTRARLPEAALVEELGGTVHVLPYLRESSTTGLIERIRGGAGHAIPAGFERLGRRSEGPFTNRLLNHRA